AGAGPVRRLGSPGRRTALWLAMALPSVAVVAAAHLAGIDVLGRIDLRLAIEQGAILLTAITAALAAFAGTLPGRDQRPAPLPLLSLGIWLASLGEACLRDWLRLGGDSLNLRTDGHCAQIALVLSVLPAVAMIVMLRRGAPLVPRLTLMLGALAVAAVANLGLR